MSDGMNESITWQKAKDTITPYLESLVTNNMIKTEESSLDMSSARVMLEQIEKAAAKELDQFLFEAFENPKHTKELKFKVTFSVDEED